MVRSWRRVWIIMMMGLLCWNYSFAVYAEENDDPIIRFIFTDPIHESHLNDGSFYTSGSIAIQSEHTFSETISKQDVTFHGVPDGINYTIERVTDKIIGYTFYGAAANHEDDDDLTITATIRQHAFDHAVSDIQTINALMIDFVSGPSIWVTPDRIQETEADDGTLFPNRLTVTTSGGTFNPYISESDIQLFSFEGMDYTVTYIDPTHIEILLSGKYTYHDCEQTETRISILAQGFEQSAIDVFSNPILVEIIPIKPYLVMSDITIVEQSANDGSITETIVGMDFIAGTAVELREEHITLNHLPEGLQYHISIGEQGPSSYTVIPINVTIYGKAESHANSDDAYVTVTVNKEAVHRAAEDITSKGTIYIDFNDPEDTTPEAPPEPKPEPNPAPSAPAFVPIVTTPIVITTNDGVKISDFTPASFDQAIEVIEKSGTVKKVIEIPVQLDADQSAEIEIPATSLAKGIQDTPHAILQMVTEGASYSLPMNILNQLQQNSGTELEDVSIRVSITKITGDLVKEINQIATEAGMKLLSEAIDFRVVADTGDQVSPVTSYGDQYVTRTITLDPNVSGEYATAALYNPVAGDFSFVPSTIDEIEGQWIATIKRNGNSIYTVVEYETTFDDIQGHWSQNDVELLASKLLVKGMDQHTFAPDEKVTRAQFAVMLAQALGLTPDAQAAPFIDVHEKAWYAGYVGAASEAGIISGYRNGSFRPNLEITREQMAVMLDRALRYADGDITPVSQADEDVTVFIDQELIHEWAVEAAATVVHHRIMTGYGNSAFGPADYATRAQAVVAIKRLLIALDFINE